MSASAPVAGSSLCVLERSIVVRRSCWVGRVAVGTTLGGAVGLAGARLGCGVVVLWVVGTGITGGVYGWNRGVMGWMIIGTSAGGGCTVRLERGALLEVRRGRLGGDCEDGWVGLGCGGIVGDECRDGLGAGSLSGRLLFGFLCCSRITAVLTSAIRWAPFHSTACILSILVGLREAVVRDGACVCMY